MSKHLKNLLAGALAATTLIGCNLGVSREEAGTPEGYYYEGYIYDGVTSARIEDFDLSVSQRGGDVSAKVAGDGHFVIGPIKPDHDYVVTIEADGYREFFAAEPGEFGLPASMDSEQTFFFEAFLFPEDIVSPEVTLEFYTPDGIDARPSGTLRLTPDVGDGLSAIHLGPTTTEGSIGGQVWANDADRRQRTVTVAVVDGEVVVDEGALVYGVTYQGTIYGSDGYAYEAFFYTSGLEGSRTVSLNRLDPQALALTHNSLEVSNVNADAEIVLTFNQPIELSEVLPVDQLGETLDDAFTILSPDYDSDLDRNVLISNVGDDPDARDRGTRLSVSGNTLTLSWERKGSNFDGTDAGDPIESVTYNALDQIVVRIADGRVDQEVNLSTLLGTDALTVFVDGLSAVNPPPPLALVSTVATGDQTLGPVTVEYTFNRPIALSPDGFTETQMREAVDNGFSINSPDSEPDAVSNILATNFSAAVQERGTTVSIVGSTVTLSWARNSLATADVDDPILEATFSNLGAVLLRPVGTAGAQDVSLGSLVGSTSEVVTLTP